MKKQIEIYVITHKKTTFPNNNIYVALQVGAALGKDLGYMKDNVGDNISEKNPYFCELTGMYWIWKNSEADIVGITHYRRYFFLTNINKQLNRVIDKESIEKYLKDYNIIVPRVQKMKKYTVRKEYEARHHIGDLDNARKIISEIFPEYITSFDRVMNMKKYYHYNMFITSKKIFDEYAEWLFKILFELEKITNIDNYDNYNKRIYGFLAERLFNVWINYNGFSLKEVPVCKIDDSIVKQIKNNIKNSIKNILIKGN